MVLGSIETTAENHCNVSVESVLRLRPLLKRETEDTIVLEQVKSVMRNAPATVVLTPMPASLTSPIAGGLRGRAESDATANNVPTEYHFNHVLPDSTSQDKIYYTLGLPIATAAMNSLKNIGGYRSKKEPKSHVLVCMGVTGSGKTYTCLGGSSVSKRRASQDGLVPRLVDSLFSQSKHHAGNKNFSVNISIAQVTHSRGSDPHASVMHDLLSTGSSAGAAEKPQDKKPKRNLTVRGMAAKFERVVASPIRSRTAEVSELDIDNIELCVEECADVTQAREVLQKGLANSAKIAKGQNHHLLITLQPVSNCTHLGDKIAVLDLAGLEKGGRKSLARGGKDSVANQNQEASAAVLHCLRTMMHNTNVRNGKTNVIDVADDEISEISAVSQKKDPLRRQLKAVPFRQHKVTMLLQSLFTHCSMSKVTLLLSAYPGHADYSEKRILLQDMELLCGAALVSTGGNATVGMAISESHSVGSFDSSRRSSSESEEERSSQGSVRSFRNNFENKFRSASPSNSLALSASLDEADANVAQPPAFAPSFSKGRGGQNSVPAPSAPPLEVAEPHAPLQRHNARIQPRNPDYVSDFPGVHLPAKNEVNDPVIERTRVTSTVTSSKVGGRWAPSPPTESQEQDYSSKQRETEGGKYRERDCLPESKTTRQPLARSSLENLPSPSKETMKSSSYNNRDTETGRDREEPGKQKRIMETERAKPRALQAISSPRQKTPEFDRHGGRSNKDRSNRETNRRHSISRDSEDARNEARRLKELEKKIQELQRQKEAFEHRCSSLEEENMHLKNSVKEVVTNSQPQWTKYDEEQFQKAREARLEDQTLVKKCLRSHMDRVSYFYEIKNQWAMTDKPHFDLALPEQFQRAPVLDIRDKQWEEKEALVMGGQMDFAVPKDEHAKQVSPPKMNIKKPKRLMKKSEAPTALSALKKLTQV